MAKAQNPRVKVSKANINKAIERMVNSLAVRLKKKGHYSYAGNHEALGILTEEYLELQMAVHQNNDEEVASELIDLGVGCIFAVAGMLAKKRIKR